jgi:hypothetical protein
VAGAIPGGHDVGITGPSVAVDDDAMSTARSAAARSKVCGGGEVDVGLHADSDNEEERIRDARRLRMQPRRTMAVDNARVVTLEHQLANPTGHQALPTLLLELNRPASGADSQQVNRSESYRARLRGSERFSLYQRVVKLPLDIRYLIGVKSLQHS